MAIRSCSSVRKRSASMSDADVGVRLAGRSAARGRRPSARGRALGAAVDLDVPVRASRRARAGTRARPRPRRGSASRRSRRSRGGSGRRSRAARRPTRRSRPAPRSSLGVRARHQRLVRDVEADHRHVEAAREHARSRLGVGPDVELGRRRDVSLARSRRPSARSARRAAASGWRASRSATFVSGPVGDERDRPVGATMRSARKSTACSATGAPCGRRQRRARRGRSRRGRRRRRRARARAAGRRPAATGIVAAAGELEHAERVRGRLLERLVAGDGRDAEQLDLGARRARAGARSRRRGPGRSRAGSACSRARVSRRPRAAVGSDGCAPGREAAIAPGRAGAAQRLLPVAALEQRDDEAGGERVAGGRAVDGLHARRRGARDLAAVLEQDRALGAERQRRRGAVVSGPSASSS